LEVTTQEQKGKLRLGEEQKNKSRIGRAKACVGNGNTKELRRRITRTTR